MWAVGRRAQLRLVEGRHEEGVVGTFDRPDLTATVHTGDDHPAFVGHVLEPWIEPIVAGRRLDGSLSVVQFLQHGAGS